MLYRTAKIFHLLGLVLWLGPSTGGFILMSMAEAQRQTFLRLWITREYSSLLYIEAAGLMVLLATGLIMRALGPGLRQERWLKLKMAIVVLVFIPLEAIQAYIYSFIVGKGFAVTAGLREALTLYDRFNLYSLAVLGLTVPMVFFLAVFRPRLGKKG